MVSPGQRLNDRYADGDYLMHNPTWHEEDSWWKARKVLLMLERSGLAVRSLVEVGCGSGKVLIDLEGTHQFSELVGYEISPDAFKICSAKQDTDVKFVFGDISELKREFDLLVCLDVIEHVEDYIGFTRMLRSKAEFKIFHFPLDLHLNSLITGSLMRARESVGHLHYFTRETALATLKDAGYSILDEMLAAPFEKNGIGAKTVKSEFLSYPRRILHRLSPSFTAKTLGGSTLFVLAK